jgi:uncharacterized protein YbaR (Trm112 family)
MIQEVDVKEFRVCRVCGYEKGFHVYFREKEDGHRIGLICPSCGQSYEIGWIVPGLAETAEKGTQF